VNHVMVVVGSVHSSSPPLAPACRGGVVHKPAEHFEILHLAISTTESVATFDDNNPFRKTSCTMATNRVVYRRRNPYVSSL
jgi:hypothetical protein